MVQPISGTTWAAYKPAKLYETKQHKPATALTGAEYSDFIRRVFHEIRRSPKPKGRQLIFIHDRSTAHQTSQVKQQFPGTEVQVQLLPPRSPDLDPLDYAVFAHSKNWLKKQNIKDWDQRCGELVKHLKGLDPVIQTAGYRRRLQKVIQAEGGHIED